MIFMLIAAPTSISSDSNVAKKRSFGHLPSVCRDWQDFFEPHLFRQLVVDNSRLSVFREAIEHHPERLLYIQDIMLRVKLPEYDCPTCRQVEDEVTISRLVLLQLSSLSNSLTTT